MIRAFKVLFFRTFEQIPGLVLFLDGLIDILLLAFPFCVFEFTMDIIFKGIFPEA